MADGSPPPRPACDRVAGPDERHRPSREEAEAAVRTLIAFLGDDPRREGLLDTPRRVVEAYGELFAGYGRDPAAPLARVFADVGGYDDMVLVRDIPFHSHCEHHMMAFSGRVHVAYYPEKGVVGLSKLARVVDLFARRLQTQERLTAEIAAAIEAALRPRGLAVMIVARHDCLALRGIRAAGSSTVTTRVSGLFRDDPAERARFLALVGQPTTAI